ncbi:sterol desaturase family protein [Rhizobium sp. 18055]|uniref:sterol desaturase family protein n=1 Tax=Rhizobium sp. 18055 TaxID=2681403 RepID=UPI0013588D0F|nr:sterol desaturase family protein [Rhizobium sp. 18055]
MDDLNFGTRDKRGHYIPNGRLELAPIWSFPPKVLKLLKWLPGYFFPWNAFLALTAVAYWHFIIPDRSVLAHLTWSWPLILFAANAASLFVVYGFFELNMFVLKRQGTRFKYNNLFPGEQKSDVFISGNQNIDNALRTFLISIPLWTAVEVLVLWAFANGYVPWLTFTENPWKLAIVALIVPLIHETHFYAIHRLIHTPFLYKWVHSIHHNSVNPSPWSSLSMHPLEALLYFSVGVWHLILPSNPLIALYQLNTAGLGAFIGHLGFDRIEVTEASAFGSHAYSHYLHHKHFEVNYADGVMPFDHIFGSYHDGTKEADERMKVRFRKKKERIAAKLAKLAKQNAQ